MPVTKLSAVQGRCRAVALMCHHCAPEAEDDLIPKETARVSLAALCDAQMTVDSLSQALVVGEAGIGFWPFRSDEVMTVTGAVCGESFSDVRSSPGFRKSDEPVHSQTRIKTMPRLLLMPLAVAPKRPRRLERNAHTRGPARSKRSLALAPLTRRGFPTISLPERRSSVSADGTPTTTRLQRVASVTLGSSP